MSEKDRLLVEEARTLHRPIEWEDALELERQAESPEAKEAIERIAILLYHRDCARG